MSLRVTLLLLSPMLASMLLVSASLSADAEKSGLPHERNVEFHGAGGVRLSGTLTLPGTPLDKPAAGVVLIQGSGPTDRDGNQGAAFRTDLLSQLSTELARKGVASLRYDKRGQYGSEPAPKEPEALTKWVAWENYVGDVVAAFRTLQARPEVRAGRAGILGHSEGGLLALQATAGLAKQRRPPATLILAATPGRPSDVIFREQLTRGMDRQGATAEQKRFFLEANDAIAAEIRKTGQVPKDVHPGLAALYPPYIGGFYRSQLQMDLPALALQVRCPVLILHGARDQQDSAERDAPATFENFRKRKKGVQELFIIPDTSHNLKRVKSDTEPGFAGDVVPEAIEALQAWVVQHLGK